MYYIFILHQTTTAEETKTLLDRLYYIFILHQTTTGTADTTFALSCIISSFYIKPQPPLAFFLNILVVLYLHSTSNHNKLVKQTAAIYVVLYLHSTSNHNYHRRDKERFFVVLYLHSTSNHNIYHLHYWYSAVWKPYWAIWSCLMRLI